MGGGGARACVHGSVRGVFFTYITWLVFFMIPWLGTHVLFFFFFNFRACVLAQRSVMIGVAYIAVNQMADVAVPSTLSFQLFGLLRGYNELAA